MKLRKPWIAVLAAALLATSAAAQEKKKEEKKSGAKTTASPDDIMKEAETKYKAGDVDGAIEDLKRAAAMDSATGEPSLRLGRALESKFDLDLAIDAYTAGAAKLTGAAKGEALGRLSVLQDTRGMTAEAAASATAAAQADPSGAWPTIAMSRQRAREGKGDEAVGLAQKAAATEPQAAASALAYAQ